MARASWFDADNDIPNLEAMVQELDSFSKAMADGRIDNKELGSQQDRVVAAMKSVEADLSDEQHAKVTALLVEVTAYDIMRTIHELQTGRPPLKL